MHEEMWNQFHKELEKLIEKDTSRCPAYACHEIQALMNEIELRNARTIKERD